MTLQYAIIALVALQRIVELAYARRNSRSLLDAGAVEHGAGHYPLFVLLHTSWLAALALWPMRSLDLWLLGAFIVLQILRVWVVFSLGGRWTTRVLVLPGAPLIRRGPYRYLRHPNYMIVAGEVAILPLAFGLWEIAVIFSILNGLLLTRRIRTENRALAEAVSLEGME